MTFLHRLFGCNHVDTVREHRDDGWYWVCQSCGEAGLINPRDRDVPKATGRYDERKAVAAKARAEKSVVQRRAAAARRTESIAPAKARSTSTNVLPIRRAQ